MTTLRFIGDLPLWMGLITALIVALLAWRYYRRESLELPHRLRWFLPLLRALAFFLGVMVLTGPVLHHKTIIGQLGKVQIYTELSGSMTMHDRHMSLGRKLLVAEQLGWLSEGKVDATLLNVADELADARREFGRSIESGDSNDAQQAASSFLTTLKSQHSQIPTSVADHFNAKLISPLETLIANEEFQLDTLTAELTSLAKECEAVEALVRESFEQAVVEIVSSGDEAINTALTVFDETPRWRRSEMALNDSAAKVLTTLQEEHDVEVFALAGTEAVAESTKLEASDSSEPVFASVTDLSTGVASTQKTIAVADTAEDLPAQANSAIVLLTDGQHNSGPSPLQTARVLGSQGVAFYCVSMGASQQAPDLAVMGVAHPDMVFQTDRVRGTMTIRDQMPIGKPFIAQIRHADEVLWQQQLTTQNLAERKIDFEFAIDELVQHIGSQFDSDVRQHALPLAFQASVTPQADESETSNNQQVFRLAAITESYKVLILDGRSRWETRYLRNAFSRDEQWHVDTVIAGAGTDDAALPRGEHKDQFPADRDALFDYDMIVFGEIAASLFSEHELTWLSEFVEIRGGGIVFIDGQRGTLKSLKDCDLVNLLPIEWLPNVASTKPSLLALTDRGATEGTLKLAIDEQQNRRFWSELPTPHNVVSVEALPDAEVLAEVTVNGEQRPAIVTRPFGAGRVLYMAFDETWRWRYKAADTWHQRIWNQLAKFVMPRPFAVSDDYVSIDSGSVSYDSGDSVDIRVRLLGLDGKPATSATADALVWKDGRVVSTITLAADEEVPGIYRGRCEPLPEGEYEVSVRASGYSESVLKARTEFVVRPPESGEMAQTAANEELLKQMAVASGGAFLREEEAGRLPELLKPLSSGRVVESETLLWQSYWWFAAIVILMTMEWSLRKRAGLL